VAGQDHFRKEIMIEDDDDVKCDKEERAMACGLIILLITNHVKLTISPLYIY
jgi:hypothetical protein